MMCGCDCHDLGRSQDNPCGRCRDGHNVRERAENPHYVKLRNVLAIRLRSLFTLGLEDDEYKLAQELLDAIWPKIESALNVVQLLEEASKKGAEIVYPG